MTEAMDSRFDTIFRSRSKKLRETGRTMVIGDGLYNIGGMNYLEDLMEFVGPWIDAYKFQRGALGLQSPELVQSKLALFDRHDVVAFPGGNFLEAALHEGVEEAYMAAIDKIGCPGIEVSSTSIELALEEKAALVAQAVERGFHVHAEIGKKETESGGKALTEDEVREEIEAVLDAGAETVILEMDQLKQMNADSDNFEIIETLVADYGTDRLLFELPLTSYYEVMETSWWYIDRIGVDVNLGNVSPEHVMPLEQQRRGLGQYAFGATFS